MNLGTMKRMLGFDKTNFSVSKSDIWLLGTDYRVAQEGYDEDSLEHSEGFAAFVEDFSSRILITYRKGFAPIRGTNTKYSSDVHWGCMLRSSQMLVSQAFLVHKLGRSWRKSPEKPLDKSYIEILSLFGDAEDLPFSIHNLLQAGKAHGLAPGSWVGPYAMCRTWENLVRNKWTEISNRIFSPMMTVYVVSGDEDGERVGAPVLCIQDIFRHFSELSGDQFDWVPTVLMVPLVLGLEKVNTRYLPLLSATFKFPQSLGVLGGKPGASTYIVGVQDSKAFYLDPHEVQQVVHLERDSSNADTSSYHCNTIRHIALDSIDPSLAIGFYCRDKSMHSLTLSYFSSKWDLILGLLTGDFDDLCLRTSDLVDQSNGAPLFTIKATRSSPKPATYGTTLRGNSVVNELYTDESENFAQEDGWQLL